MSEKRPWIQTCSGKKFYVDEAEVEQIAIEDIAHALSMMCRFNGHCIRFYSVAEHSVHVSYEIDEELALVGLLHDAAEAYLGDVVSPLKKQLKDFKCFEKRMEAVIAERFGIDAELFSCEELKRADVQLLVDEKARVMVKEPEQWPDDTPLVQNPSRIECWSQVEAKKRFLERFEELRPPTPDYSRSIHHGFGGAVREYESEVPNAQIVSALLQAYQPCPNFGICREAQWRPELGHIPRGFLGATGELSEVEVVMVFSEPGHPHDQEQYNSDHAPHELLSGCVNHAYSCFRDGKDQFHRNARWFIDQLFPDLEFDQQLKKIWLTEGRLCSISNEIGSTTDRTCASAFLAPQLDLFPNATVVAFGRKAQRYLRGLNVDCIDAYALAPPGANHRPARPSWEGAIDQIKARRAASDNA